jgi:hypothetical protein
MRWLQSTVTISNVLDQIVGVSLWSSDSSIDRIVVQESAPIKFSIRAAAADVESPLHSMVFDRVFRFLGLYTYAVVFVVAAMLNFTYTPKYPEEIPDLALDTVRDINEDQAEDLRQHLLSLVQQERVQPKTTKSFSTDSHTGERKSWHGHGLHARGSGQGLANRPQL